MDVSTERAKRAYNAFRNGFREISAPPPWEELSDWIRDAIIVGYLQGKLDYGDRNA